MFNFHVTLAMALHTLRSIVQEFGEDHMGTLDDGGCAYVDEHSSQYHLKSSCIVGKAFDRWGLLRTLVSTTGACGVRVKGTDLVNQGAFGLDLRQTLAEDFGITFDNEAFTLLNRAQVAQDGDVAWGPAVEHAARAVEQQRGYSPPPATAVERLLGEPSPAAQVEQDDSDW